MKEFILFPRFSCLHQRCLLLIFMYIFLILTPLKIMLLQHMCINIYLEFILI